MIGSMIVLKLWLVLNFCTIVNKLYLLAAIPTKFNRTLALCIYS